MKKFITCAFALFCLAILTSCSLKYEISFYDENGNFIEEKEIETVDESLFPKCKEEGFYYEWDISTILDGGKYTLNAIKKEANKISKFYINGTLVKEEDTLYSENVEKPVIGTEYKNITYKEDTKRSEDLKTYYYTWECSCDLQTFEVIFVDSDGNILKEETVEYGKSATAPATDKKISWDVSFENIVEDTVVTGKYITYKVVFVDSKGNFLKEEVVYDGENATAPVLDKEIVWDKDFTNVQEAMRVVGTYVVYTVSFYDEEGTLLKEEEVYKGNDATAPSVNGEISWDKSFTNVTENLIITGTYISRFFKITYYDGLEELKLNPDKYSKGDSFDLPTPSKEGYYFIGWFVSDISLYNYTKIDANTNGNLVLYARYLQISGKEQLVLPESSYKFTTINKNPHGSGNGTFVYQPSFPSGVPSTSVVAYDWSSSDTSVATVSAYSSITAKSAGFSVITATLKTDSKVTINIVIKVTADGVFASSVEEANDNSLCTVTFKGKNNETIATSVCLKDGSVIYPVPLIYEGYAFISWDKDNYNITSDTTITALYKEGTNNYTGKKISIIGDSISTFSSVIPSGFSSFYPYPTADVNDVNQTWWMQTINKLGAGLFINNSYSGTCVAEESPTATKNNTRLSYSKVGDITPDVIIIYMGSNDCASQYIGLQSFDLGYKQMIDNMKIMFPDTEIICMTLCKTVFYSDSERASYSAVIEKYALQYNLKCIDMKDVDLSSHLVDSAHPNKSGMDIISEKVVNFLLEN